MKLFVKFCICCFLAPLFAMAADPQADGRAFLAQGDSNNAVKKFSEAAQINPFDASALNNQAVAYAAQGDTDKALQLLERAVKLAPNRADIASNLNELRNWMNKNNPNVSTQKNATPFINPYPGQNSLPPEPPALWKPAAH